MNEVIIRFKNSSKEKTMECQDIYKKRGYMCFVYKENGEKRVKEISNDLIFDIDRPYEFE